MWYIGYFYSEVVPDHVVGMAYAYMDTDARELLLGFSYQSTYKPYARRVMAMQISQYDDDTIRAEGTHDITMSVTGHCEMDRMSLIYTTTGIADNGHVGLFRTNNIQTQQMIRRRLVLDESEIIMI